jgi:hypothetical protein
MAKTNIDYLRENLTDEQSEWLDGVISDHHKECAELELRVTEYQQKADEWEDRYDNKDTFSGSIIDTGIGIIRYETEGSLDIVQLMGAIAEVIKDQGPTALLRHLVEVYAV